MGERRLFKARRVADPTVSGWLPDHAVLVEGERITAVLPAARLPGDAAETSRIHDLGDVSLLPGLVDCHAHLHCSATPDAYRLVTSESPERLVLRAAASTTRRRRARHHRRARHLRPTVRRAERIFRAGTQSRRCRRGLPGCVSWCDR